MSRAESFECELVHRRQNQVNKQSRVDCCIVRHGWHRNATVSVELIMKHFRFIKIERPKWQILLQLVL
jgi:hypothetical protein